MKWILRAFSRFGDTRARDLSKTFSRAWHADLFRKLSYTAFVLVRFLVLFLVVLVIDELANLPTAFAKKHKDFSRLSSWINCLVGLNVYVIGKYCNIYWCYYCRKKSNARGRVVGFKVQRVTFKSRKTLLFYWMAQITWQRQWRFQNAVKNRRIV